jgi:hypothetical protein
MIEIAVSRDQRRSHLAMRWSVTAFVRRSIAWWDYDVDRWVQDNPIRSYTAMHQLARLASWYGEQRNAHHDAG